MAHSDSPHHSHTLHAALNHFHLSLDKVDHVGLIKAKDPNELIELKERIGKGSHGEVFKAELRSTNMIVAVKVISVTQGDFSVSNSIHEEIKHLQSCKHPNIVCYYDSFILPRQFWVRLRISE